MTAPNAPIISIGLPAFNSEKTLAIAIVSLIRQSFRHWELLVMDDGSTDRTVEIARSFTDSRIRVFSDGVHRGLPVQLNRAVQMARGKYLGRMDADDIAYPTRFEKQVAFLEANPEIDLVAGWMAVFRGDGSLLGARRAPTIHAEICARRSRGFPMPHPTWIGRVEWFRENPYSESAVGMEDRELLLRTYRHSRFAVIPEVLLAYREDPRSLVKLLKARKNICKIALTLLMRRKSVSLALEITVAQCVRALMEVLAVPTGLDHKLLGSRTSPATEGEAREWHEMWLASRGRTNAGDP